MFEVRQVESLAEQARVREIFDSIWPAAGQSQVTSNLLQAMVHSGAYVVGVYDCDQPGEPMIGASFAFPAIEPEIHLHSHMTGFLEGYRDRGLGTQVKMHQWHWAKEHGYASITWTFDPLVSRNAKFNLHKLGADFISYEPNFYGVMEDALNAGEQTDRIIARWDLQTDKPVPKQLHSHYPDSTRTIEIPEDIVALRQQNPAKSAEIRLRVREQFQEALASGYKVSAFTPDNRYILERP